MSVRLYIGNLPEELNRQELEAVFSEVSPVSTKIITDRKTNKCRGFGFVTVKSEEQADEVIERFNGFLLKESNLKVERAQPRKKEKEDGTEDTPERSSETSVTAGARRKGNGNNKGRKSSSSPSDESVQPDPRWAQELEKLKQLLAAQTTNP
jgi:RNA recognition motif-containing protein